MGNPQSKAQPDSSSASFQKSSSLKKQGIRRDSSVPGLARLSSTATFLHNPSEQLQAPHHLEFDGSDSGSSTEEMTTASSPSIVRGSWVAQPSQPSQNKSSAQAQVELLQRKIQKHQEDAENAFDLVASNSHCSKQVREIMGSALMDSYCIGLPGQRFYGGCSNIDEIETLTRQTVCELFGARYCEVQLLSGMMANIAAYNAMLPGMGCTVMASPSKNGGHYSHNAGGPLTRLFGANVVTTPFDAKSYNVDLEALPVAMKTHKPALLIVGWSEMLFEHDLPALRAICDEHNCKLMYDMSHVAGLVAGGVFQSNLMNYVDICASSTGKSLHSSDHGLVLYNDDSYTPKIREAVMPLLTSNTHFHETASLCMTLSEMKEFGKAYSRQVVANTRALAKEMVKRKFKVLCPKLGYSRTHELIVDLGQSGVEATQRLDKARVFVNPQELPEDTAVTGPTGLRLGTQVLTRRGFQESDMAAVAKSLEDVLKRSKNVFTVGKDVAKKSSTFTKECFSFSAV